MAKKRRTKGDGALFRRSDGMWIGRVDLPTTDGRRRRKTVASKDFATAAKKLRKLRTEIDEGRIPVTATTTVAAWLDYWLASIHTPMVRPTTRSYYESTIRLHITPHIGRKRLDRLTPEDVRVLHRAVQKMSTRAAQKAHQVLVLALKDAEKEGMLYRNVAAAVSMPKHVKERREAFSVEVARHIIDTAVASRDVSETSRWAAAFLTGARQGELLGLTWDRVDLELGVMNLAWQLQHLPKVHGCLADGAPTCGRLQAGSCPQGRWDFPPGFEFVVCHRSLVWTRPKSAAGARMVPIVAPLLVMLKAHANTAGPNPHQLVWHHSDGRPIGPREDNKAWKQLLVDAKVITDQETLPLHVARHTTATLLRAAGVDEQTRMEIIGHSSQDTQRMYAHADAARHHAAMANLNELLA